MLYERLGQFKKAEEFYLEGMAIREKKPGKEHPDFANSLNSLAVLYYKMGQREKAEPLFLEAKDIRQRTLGKEDPSYASSLNNLALLYKGLGQYDKAEPYLLEAKAIREKRYGKEHPEYTLSVNNLANLYRDMDQYEKAEQFYFEAKGIREKMLGKEHTNYATSVNDLASLYYVMGQYEKAEALFLEAIIIRGKKLGKEHQDYAVSVSGLANLYSDMGRYEKAEPLYLEAIAIREKKLGKEHLYYAQSLRGLAILYESMGRYDEAELLYLQAKAIREKKVGKEHLDYAMILGDLAVLYGSMGQNQKVESLLLEAKSIEEKASGKEGLGYALSLNNLAVLYEGMGRYEEAETLLLESKAIREKTLGKEHPDYTQTLVNLAAVYAGMEQNDKVEPLLLEAKSIRDRVLGKEHPAHIRSLHTLATLYEKQNRFSASEELLAEASVWEQVRLSKASSFLSERELSNYTAIFQKNRDNLNSHILARSLGNKSAGALSAISYNQALFYKGFLLSAAGRLNKLAMATPETGEVNIRLKGYLRRLASEYAKPIAERKNVAELEKKANTLEKELARTIAGYGEAIRQINWQEVQNALKADEAIVEFVHFNYSNPKPTDSILYAALLLRSDWPRPRMVALFEQKNIQPLLNAANTSAAAGQLYAARGNKKRGKTQKSEGIVVGIGESASLYQLIWQPLDSLLNSPSMGGGRGEAVKTVYFSPSGLLHRLNLAAVPIPDSGQVLADRYRLVQLGSTRQFVVGSGTSSSARTATLFGGLKYDAQTTVAPDTALAAKAPAKADHYDLTAIRRSLDARGNENWSYLPGTEKEVRNIATTLGKAGYTFQSFTGYDGTEAAFKSLGTNNNASPTILHIATHGFFFPDPASPSPSKGEENRHNTPGWGEAEPVFKTSDNPLMRSGLILAGANRAWAGGKTPEGQEDGILTAYEISQMNLSSTELVVLSACETGLGDVSGNEGVYGLQRAFKIAGAKYLVMSLWQVPDKETSEFMNAFYRKWLEEKMSVPDAFQVAQREMRERFENPYLWAGFVLVE